MNSLCVCEKVNFIFTSFQQIARTFFHFFVRKFFVFDLLLVSFLSGTEIVRLRPDHIVSVRLSSRSQRIALSRRNKQFHVLPIIDLIDFNVISPYKPLHELRKVCHMRLARVYVYFVRM